MTTQDSLTKIYVYFCFMSQVPNFYTYALFLMKEAKQQSKNSGFHFSKIMNP